MQATCTTVAKKPPPAPIRNPEWLQEWREIPKIELFADDLECHDDPHQCAVAKVVMEHIAGNIPLTFRYSGGSEPGSVRTVHPILLFYQDYFTYFQFRTDDPTEYPEFNESPFYLLGWCQTRQAARTFRLDRMQADIPMPFLLPTWQVCRFFNSMTSDSAIERLYQINPGTTPDGEGCPHERPHKPLLLLAAFDLIDEGLATPDRIPWCQVLRVRFSSRFLLARKHNDQNTPENQEDHTINGLALCKNHHWHVTKLIDPRRSNGERQIHELAGKSLLLPQDPVFHPVEQGLKWRCERLCA